MIIGMSSACFYPDVRTENSIELMKTIGFNTGELFLNSISEYEDDFGKLILEQELINDFKVNSVHAFSVSFEPYLFDSYKRRRDDCFVVFKKVCKMARTLGANCYTFHGMRYQNMSSIDMNMIIDVYDKLTYTAAECGIKLCQENVFWCMSNSIEFLYEIREKCKGPLYFTLDIKQAYKAGKLPDDYIEVMKYQLANFHINDRSKNSICLLPGQGDVNYKKIFCKLKEIGYNGIGIIEVYKENYNEYTELIKAKKYLDMQKY
ncbi:sugar phosphate isomerase/epimerase family protein [Clostridium tyrobutyricum]|uniref:sugar phosphate isomerase/epimerase family protein n=1 Tax=Clostridium tyrobutyricum TaxID=1519 RepID=UPI001C382B7D|nr:sugar phosphate isomerase/epimerase [Clostridium tyrobutyricum]MBV4424544.1 sugar phosphate isomerase/epimerase [Clostridium tyrobutyricum]